MVKPRSGQFQVGVLVRVVKIPADLPDAVHIGTPRVFEQALGKTFRVEAVSELGHLELVVAERRPSKDTYESDTIWIEPEFVETIDDATRNI
jgi:hypothetical protein